MALANFLGKSALSASQVLKDFDYEGFQQILLSHHIRVCFDKKTVLSSEGFASVDLLVRLLARLYPNIHLQCTDGKSPELDHFIELARAINPFIDMRSTEPTAVIVVGESNIKFSCLPLYIGSDQWIAKFSRTRPQLCGPSVNRFGAGAAACFAAANLFRYVFSGQLPAGGPDNDFIYSCFNGNIDEEAGQGPAINIVNLADTVLVGVGAIGNGFVWAMKDIILTGSLQLVDGEKADLGNLQRYVLATQHDINQQKVNFVTRFLDQPAVLPNPVHFDKYLEKRGNWNIYRAVVCVDSADDRRLVQGSLPQRIINAWTQAEQCAISRHYDFLDDACLGCLYVPEPEKKSLPLKIAESLGITHEFHINLVRDYMANRRPVDAGMIGLIAQCKNIDPQSLMPYIGKQLEVFYAEVICGGVMMELTGGAQREAGEVPSAFESAFAGIMLAAETVIDCGALRRQKPTTIHKLNLLRPITIYTSDNVNKDHSLGCICHDAVYRDRYETKWRKTAFHRTNGDDLASETDKLSSNVKMELWPPQ
jgi:hypothetical protein